MRDRALVIEEFAVDGPALIALPNGSSDQSRSQFGDRLAQGEGALALVNDIAESFIRRRSLVGGGSGGPEPALIDTPAMGSQGVQILRRQLDSPAGPQKGTRPPGGRQAEDSLARFKDFLYSVLLGHLGIGGLVSVSL